MNWDKLDIHLENLVPGLATLWALSLHWQPPALDADISRVVLGVSLVGAAYLAGVVVNVACRLALDPASELLTRQWVFKLLARGKLRDLKGATRKAVNDAYNYYCTRAISEDKGTAKEVGKRRQTGRLLRSSLVPIVLLQLYASHTCALGTSVTVGALAGEALALLLLYGYSEVIVLQEAYFAVPEDERSVTRIQQILNPRP